LEESGLILAGPLKGLKRRKREDQLAPRLKERTKKFSAPEDRLQKNRNPSPVRRI
jgi:hypothetical protein